MSSNPATRPSTRRGPTLIARAVVLVASALGALVIAPVTAGRAAAAPGDPPAPLDTWAWCGVHPDDPTAVAAARSMAVDSGIDVTFGPCNVPTPDYTPAFTANRYVSPELYRRLVDINAAAGMTTVVYDSRVWSADANVRAAAIAFWAPVYQHIEAWDLGDEFDPDGPEWPILVQRWNLVRSQVTPLTGIEPFTNHLYWALDEALADLPGSEQLLSFTRYDADLGVAQAEEVDDRTVRLMCGVNAFTHFSFTPSEDTIRADMATLRAAGCDQILVFGGQQVYGSTVFGGSSLVDMDTGEPTRWAPAVLEGSGRSSFHGVTPARLLETRTGPGLVTVDGRQNGVGRRGDASLSGVEVTGRAGIPDEVAAVSLNITAVDPARAGFVTVYPCGETQPLASQLNHGRATTISAALIVRPGADGRVCVYTMAETDLVVDVNGYVPIGAAFESGVPARLLETRTGEGYTTVDGADAGIGVRTGGTITELQVTGRAGVPSTVNAVVLNVTVTGARAAGYLTVFPCGGPIPTASNVNYTLGATITNAAVTATSATGNVCLFTSADIDLVVDVGGHLPLAAPISTAPPVRVLDSRSGPGLSTIDGLQIAIGARTADTVTRLPIAGRAAIPAGTSAVVLGVTITEARRPGFVTVFPCNGVRPAAANVNFVAGQTVANLVVADLADDGSICLYTMAGTHLVVDVLSALP